MTKFYPPAISAAGELIIPAIINDKPVVAIADNAFAPLFDTEVRERVVRIVVPATIRDVEKIALSLIDVVLRNVYAPMANDDEATERAHAARLRASSIARTTSRTSSSAPRIR